MNVIPNIGSTVRKSVDFIERISSNSDICHGKPCIKGTRIPVYLIVSLIAYGEDIPSIIQNYPSITHDDITASMKYAAQLCKYEAYAI
ncbi:MAG: hypothetical protein B6242_17085 [Anaerolineaceae bacterium 4572_78]|nr:MAG: hypothetical protein B6242_17085 [Anaerolineaceae bacterium 4572_78]